MQVWEDGTNPETIFEHYGYTDLDRFQRRSEDCRCGYWPKETVMERITAIPEFLELTKLCTKRFRIVIDYDPEFPRTLIRVTTNHTPERAAGPEAGAVELDPAELEEPQTPEEEAESERSRSMFRYFMGKDLETGEIEIGPMNDGNRIVFAGPEEARWFIEKLKELIQETTIHGS